MPAGAVRPSYGYCLRGYCSWGFPLPAPLCWRTPPANCVPLIGSGDDWCAAAVLLPYRLPPAFGGLGACACSAGPVPLLRQAHDCLCAGVLACWGGPQPSLPPPPPPPPHAPPPRPPGPLLLRQVRLDPGAALPGQRGGAARRHRPAGEKGAAAAVVVVVVGGGGGGGGGGGDSVDGAAAEDADLLVRGVLLQQLVVMVVVVVTASMVPQLRMRTCS